MITNTDRRTKNASSEISVNKTTRDVTGKPVGPWVLLLQNMSAFESEFIFAWFSTPVFWLVLQWHCLGSISDLIHRGDFSWDIVHCSHTCFETVESRRVAAKGKAKEAGRMGRLSTFMFHICRVVFLNKNTLPCLWCEPQRSISTCSPSSVQLQSNFSKQKSSCRCINLSQTGYVLWSGAEIKYCPKVKAGWKNLCACVG